MTKKLRSVPLNINSAGCESRSSNCVTWQGPDVPCLNLCKGDSITQVIYDLAINFCELYSQLDPETYNTQCLELEACAKNNFHALFQSIIDKVCELASSEPFGGCNVLATIQPVDDTTFEVNVANATLPVTYNWYFAQSGHIGAAFTGATNQSSVVLTYNAVTLQDGTDPAVKIRQALLKVIVTDKNGCHATDVFLINQQ